MHGKEEVPWKNIACDHFNYSDRKLTGLKLQRQPAFLNVDEFAFANLVVLFCHKLFWYVFQDNILVLKYFTYKICNLEKKYLSDHWFINTFCAISAKKSLHLID